MQVDQYMRTSAVAIVVAAGLLVPAVAHADLSFNDEKSASEPVPGRDEGITAMSSASNGTDFLIAWTELESVSKIRATRMTRDGVVLDLSAIRFPSSVMRQFGPRVAWDGTTYVVAWTEFEPTSDPETEEPAIVRAVRVDVDGVLLDAIPIEIATVPGLSYMQVAASQGVVTVSWTSPSIQFARISSGVLLDSTPVDVGTGPGWSGALSCTASACLIASSNCTDGTCGVLGQRFDPATGDFIDASPLVIADGTFARVASNGTDWLVAFRKQETSDAGHVQVARVDTAGVVTEGTTEISGAYAHWLDLAFDGTNYVLIWDERRPDWTGDTGGYAMRISSAGALLDPTGGIALDAVPAVRGFGCAAGRCAVPLLSGRTELLENGAIVPPSPILTAWASVEQTAPSTAPTSSGFAVAWEELRDDGSTAIVGRFLDETGEGTGEVFPIGAGETPQLGWDGESIVVAWKVDDRILAARIAEDGTLDPPTGLDVSGPGVTEFDTAHVACTITNGCLIGWVTNPAPYVVVADGWLLPTGTPISGGRPLRFSADDGYPNHLALAASENGFLAAWRANSVEGNGDQLHATVIRADGSIENAGGIHIVDHDYADSEHALGWDVVAASNGDEYLVGWEAFTGSTIDGCNLEEESTCTKLGFYATRVMQSGRVLDRGDAAILVRETAVDVAAPDVVWTGKSYLVSWSERTDAASGGEWNVQAARVSRGGLVVDDPALTVSSFADEETAPAAALGHGVVLLTYQRYDASEGFGSNRIRMRIVDGDDTEDDWVPPSDAGCCRTSSGTGSTPSALIVLLFVAGWRRARRLRR